jgi:DNA-binding GntR family transcriptional regulator
MKLKGIRETITDHIKNLIISGKLKPGQRLNELELSEMFNVSRSPLREALLILDKENLVNIVPRKGTYVTRLSEENMRRIYQVMEMVELYAIDQLGVKERTHVPELTAAVNDCIIVRDTPSEDSEDLLLHRKILANFHAQLVKTLDNTSIIQFYKESSANLARYQYLHLLKKGSGKGMIKDHKDIIRHINHKEYKLAKKLMKTHILKSFNYKVSALKEYLKELETEKMGI